MLPSGDTGPTLAFIHRVNRSDRLQHDIRSLEPRDWNSLQKLAGRGGYDVDSESFAKACLSPQVNRFCPALSDFAGHLHLCKM